MIKTIFVTATGTNVGKTYTTLKIMELLAAKSLRAVPFKPIETGVGDALLDASALLEKYKGLYDDERLTIDDVCLYKFSLPAAPYVAASGLDISIYAINKQLEKLKNIADVVLVEGAGGLYTPINSDYFMINLAKECADFTLLVSHTKLGCINDAILSHRALLSESMWCKVVFNRRENDNFDVISKPFLRDYFGEICEIDGLSNLLNTVLS